MKKRLLCLLFALLFIFTAAPFAVALEGEFPDDDFFLDPYDFHELLDIETSERGLGMEALNLTGPTTRERAAVYLVMGHSPHLLTGGTVAANRFNDVPMSRWSFPAVTWAANRGWIVGTGNNNFSPDRNVTREEYAVMLVRAFSTPDHNATQLPFTDRNQIASWAVPYIRRAIQIRPEPWIQGFQDGTFRPRDTITREHAMLMTQRASGRTITDPVARTITWNGNSGTNPAQWQRIQGHAIGPLPTSTWSQRTFRGWSSTNGETQGTHLSPTTRMPNNNTTYWARWHNRDRHLAHWFHSATITMYVHTTDATWRTPILNAINIWNGSSTPLRVSNNANSSNVVNVFSYTWGDMGRYYAREVSGTSVRRFDILLNSRTILQYYHNNLSHFIQSIMVHETGHAAGLEDGAIRGHPVQGGSVTASIMNHRTAAQWESVRVPTRFDIQSVNWLY